MKVRTREEIELQKKEEQEFFDNFNMPQYLTEEQEDWILKNYKLKNGSFENLSLTIAMISDKFEVPKQDVKITLQVLEYMHKKNKSESKRYISTCWFRTKKYREKQAEKLHCQTEENLKLKNIIYRTFQSTYKNHMFAHWFGTEEYRKKQKQAEKLHYQTEERIINMFDKYIEKIVDSVCERLKKEK
jgi:hypothetical protein